MKFNRIALTLFSVVIGITFLYGGLILWLNWPIRDFSMSRSGVFGESFGVINTIFSGLAFAGLILTIHLQRSELAESKETFRKERFEDSFYRLLGYYRQNLDDIKIIDHKTSTAHDGVAALLRDSALKVLSRNGYHDLATPFYQTELDLARMGSQPNLQIRHYDGGHMIYLDDVSRSLENADLAAFYQGAPGWAGSPDHAAARPTRRLLTAPGQAGPAGTAGMSRALLDPYVPPARRHPASGPPSSGAALKAQAARKLNVPR